MSRYAVRTLRSTDFNTLMRLEQEVFGRTSDGVLGPYYVRLCCDFFADSCFMLEAEGVAKGYLLAFLKGRELYCTTLALLPEVQGSRAILALLRAFISEVSERVDVCWFTVEADNEAARALHAMMGAREVDVRPDFYGPGHERIISRIERPQFEAVRNRLERLGLVGSKKTRRQEVALA